MPVTSALGRLRQEDPVLGQPGLHSKVLSQKINKQQTLKLFRKKYVSAMV
jgi:hypothetical protein